MQGTGRRKGAAEYPASSFRNPDGRRRFAPGAEGVSGQLHPGGEALFDSGKGVRIGQQPALQRKKGEAAQAARRFPRKGGHWLAAVEAAFQQLRQAFQLGGKPGACTQVRRAIRRR